MGEWRTSKERIVNDEQATACDFPGGLDTTVVQFGGAGVLLSGGEAVSQEQFKMLAANIAKAHEHITSEEGSKVYALVNAHLTEMADELNQRLVDEHDKRKAAEAL